MSLNWRIFKDWQVKYSIFLYECKVSRTQYFWKDCRPWIRIQLKHWWKGIIYECHHDLYNPFVVESIDGMPAQRSLTCVRTNWIFRSGGSFRKTKGFAYCYLRLRLEESNGPWEGGGENDARNGTVVQDVIWTIFLSDLAITKRTHKKSQMYQSHAKYTQKKMSVSFPSFLGILFIILRVN